MSTLGFIGLGARAARITTGVIAEGIPLYRTNRTVAKARALISQAKISIHTAHASGAGEGNKKRLSGHDRR